MCVKFHLNRCRFAVAVAKCLGGSLFWDTVYIAHHAREAARRAGPSETADPCTTYRSRDRGIIGNESVPIQLAQCWFPVLAISNAKM